jgi:transcriptional regulator with XRE-family HTH domain
MEVASRIRALRRLQNRTLKDVAERCGFTISLLSKIESGKTAPPLATLSKIADALGVSLSELLDEKKGANSVFTPAQKLREKPPTQTSKGYSFHLLAAERGEKAMQPFLFEARQGEIASGPMSHAGEEFVYVLEGRMNYRVGSVTYTLEAGDSLYFNAEEDHDLEPLTPIVRYLGLFAPRISQD